MSRAQPTRRTRSSKAAAVLLAILPPIWACGGGTPVAPLVPADGHSHHEVVVETRPLAGVRGVVLDVSVLWELRIEQGPTESLWLRVDEVVMPHLETPVQDGVLTLTYPLDVRHASRPPLPIETVLTVVDLERIELRDGGWITASRLGVDHLVVRASGRGEILLSDLRADALEVEVLDSGPVRATGSVGRQRARLAGRGAYEAGDLASREATIEVSQAGSATVRVGDRLRAVVGGAGSVYYFGDPLVESSISGTGDVVRLGP